MENEFEVRWEGDLPAGPQEVWDAFTVRTAGWLWKIDYEPRVGGAERGLSPGGGTVTAWDQPRHFATRAELEGGGFNELEYRLEPRGSGTHLQYAQRGVLDEDYDRQLDACRQHTAFYSHSLCEYVGHFAGRDAARVAVEAPESSAEGGFAAMRRGLGLPDHGLAAGDHVRLTPAGIEPIDGVVDYTTHAFLGLRSADALYRFYGRDAWGWPVAVAHHLFGGGANAAESRKAWSRWLDGIFATEAVA